MRHSSNAGILALLIFGFAVCGAIVFVSVARLVAGGPSVYEHAAIEYPEPFVDPDSITPEPNALIEPDSTEPDPSSTTPSTVETSGRYIDRVALPSYATFLYDWMEEATDLDGQDDWLVDNRFFQGNGDGTGDEHQPGAVFQYDDGYAVSLGPVDTDDIDEIDTYTSTAWYAFDNDHPEVFWLDTTYQLSMKSYGDGTQCAFIVLSTPDWQMRSPDYRSAETIAQGAQTRDDQVAGILAETLVQGDDAATVRNFNDWLTTHNGYNTLVSDGNEGPGFAYTSLSALSGNSGERGPVCEGYSKAFKVLCDAAGIPCVLSSGDTDMEGPHIDSCAINCHPFR